MHPNEALLRRAYDAQGRGDIDGYIECLSDNIVLHIPGHSQIAGDYVGKEEVRRHFREIVHLSEETFRTEVHDVVAGDDHVIGLIDAHAERDGKIVYLPRIHVWHVRDGKLAEVWLYPADQYLFDEYWGTSDPTFGAHPSEY